MTRYDAIVVGAGPSGSAAATTLARAGMHVLLLDRAEFPRDKPCGDGISSDAVTELKAMGVWEEIQTEKFYCIYNVEYYSPNNSVLKLKLSERDRDHNFIAPRTRFDQILREHAIRSGAKYETANAVDAVIEDGNVCGVICQKNHETFTVTSPITIFAAGANSVIVNNLRKKFGTKSSVGDVGVAIRCYVETQALQDHTVRAYFNKDLLPGYCWAFPINSNLVNLGLGTTMVKYKKLGRPLSSFLDEFIQLPQLKSVLGKNCKISDVMTWTLNFGHDKTSRVYPGALLVGDAGYFVNPATGAGIGPALITGRMAGEVAIRARETGRDVNTKLKEFDYKWQNRFLQPMQQAQIVQRLLLRNSTLLNWFFWPANKYPQLFLVASRSLTKLIYGDLK